MLQEVGQSLSNNVVRVRENLQRARMEEDDLDSLGVKESLRLDTLIDWLSPYISRLAECYLHDINLGNGPAGFDPSNRRNYLAYSYVSARRAALKDPFQVV